MTREEFLDLFAASLMKNVGAPTQEEVEKAATWFMALVETEFWHEMIGLKDMAEMARDGIVGTKDMDIQEWLDLQKENLEAWDDDNQTLEAYFRSKMTAWGWK